MSAAGLRERLLHLRAVGAPPYERQQAQTDWFRACMKEGNPPDRLRRDAPTWSERFDAQVIEGLDGCLIWDGRTEQRVGGRVPILVGPSGRKRNARFYVWTRAGLELPANHRVLPSCGNPLCVRLEHLELEGAAWSRVYSSEQMLARLQVMAMRLGHTPTAREWQKEGGTPGRKIFALAFGNWEEAVRQAGLPPAPRRAVNQYSRTDWPKACRRGLWALSRYLNRPPSTRDVEANAGWLREQGLPSSANTYRKYLGGSWQEALEQAGAR